MTDSARSSPPPSRRALLRIAAGAAAGLGAAQTFPRGGWPHLRWGARAARAEPSSEGGPAAPPWRIRMVAPDEPGASLLVSGVVVGADRRAPVAGARLYVYHTDATGHYAPGRRGGDVPPRLRGWMTTDAAGRYELLTVRPGAYPGGRNPAHIHASLSAPGRAERWIEDFRFADDPLIPAAQVEASLALGRFSPIVKLARDQNGVLRGQRDILLA